MTLYNTINNNGNPLDESRQSYMVETRIGIISALEGEDPIYGTVFYVGNGAYTKIGETGECAPEALVMERAREIALHHEEG
jgi:hypothetical protein